MASSAVKMEKEHETAFCGEIKELPNIAVDNFSDKTKMAYFLSHMHSDHYVGLFGKSNSEDLRKNDKMIFMSEESKTILEHNHFNYRNLEGIVEALKTDITHNIHLPNNESFQVTLIPVKHMIGAVMFLFKTKDKTVLYTGDFMMKEDEVSTIKSLHDKEGNKIAIDALYIDSTFDNPDYAYFPSRESALAAVEAAAKQWLDVDGHALALHPYYQFGYDDIYQNLAKKLNTKIFVHTPDRTQNMIPLPLFTNNKGNIHQLYGKLYGCENFTTEDNSSKIHICRDKDNRDHKDCGVATSGKKYLQIKMSATLGFDFDPGVDENEVLSKVNENTKFLCYQTHCSKSQLDYFIAYFQPKTMTRFPKPIPTPRTWSSPFKKDWNRKRRYDIEDHIISVKRRLQF